MILIKVLVPSGQSQGAAGVDVSSLENLCYTSLVVIN